jgi:hypothetical protein
MQKNRERITLNEETTTEQPSNVVRLAFDGSGSNGPWLNNLDIGTVFLARRKLDMTSVKDFTFGVFCLISRTEKGVRLVVGEGMRQEPIWVDPVRFCNQMDFVEKIGQQMFTEVGHDEDHRPI